MTNEAADPYAPVRRILEFRWIDALRIARNDRGPLGQTFECELTHKRALLLRCDVNTRATSTMRIARGVSVAAGRCHARKRMASEFRGSR
jgi:hypothetical protein